jgi:hypothetical protein
MRSLSPTSTEVAAYSNVEVSDTTMLSKAEKLENKKLYYPITKANPK